MSDNPLPPIAKAEPAEPLIDLSEAVFFLPPSEESKWAKGESLIQIANDELKDEVKATKEEVKATKAENERIKVGIAKLVGLPIDQRQNELPKESATADESDSELTPAVAAFTSENGKRNGAPMPSGIAAILSAPDFADAIGQPVDKVDAFLRRLRKTVRGCYYETPNRGPREPKYMYYTKMVLPHIPRKWSGD